jgi:7-cyano-7-deazaguanine synthase
VLLSGGLDSATALAWALSQRYECYALSVDYGQRHRAELRAAAQVARSLGAQTHRTVTVDLSSFGGSALTDTNIEVPAATDRAAPVAAGIPITYVPARNTVLLALALAWAEVLAADHMVIGVNAVDYSGYPDCRPEFVREFERLANLATRRGVEGSKLTLHAPLLEMSKADIVRLGTKLGVDYGVTVSCYQADEQGRACGLCDACRLRAAGFVAAGLADPTIYRA